MRVEIVKRMGFPWPELGETVDVEESKGSFLVRGGYAVEAPKPKAKPKAKAKAKPKVETTEDAD